MSARTLPPALAVDLDEFEDWAAGMNWSPQTVWARLRAARFFLAEWGTWEPRPSVVAASLRRYDGWTARTYFLHLRSVFGWAVETGRASSDPTARMKAPPTPRPQPRPLDPETLQRVVGTASGRARAYMLLAFLAGLRAHEIAKIRGEDVTRERIHVVGKGGKVAAIPTHPALWALAQEYPREGYWFTSHMGERGPVTVKAVQQTVRLHLRAHGVKTGTIHQFRASYGTELLRSGANIRVVQDLMRHSSLSSTEHYLGVSDTERRDAITGLQSAICAAAGGHEAAPLPSGGDLADSDDDAQTIPLPDRWRWDPPTGTSRVVVAAAASAPGPCPPWCEVGEGHPYDPFAGRTRIHARGVSRGLVITALTEAVDVGGPEVVVEAGLALSDELPELVGGHAARLLAGRLLEAAEQLEQLGLDQAVEP